jgi:hypothetical protein
MSTGASKRQFENKDLSATLCVVNNGFTKEFDVIDSNELRGVVRNPLILSLALSKYK